MRRLHTLIFAFIAIVLVFGGAGREIGRADAATQVPLRTINVAFDPDLRELYVSQIRKFADTYAFAIRVAQSSPSPDHILVQLWREDVKLISVISPDTTEQSLMYFVGIYENGDQPIPTMAVDQLVEGLRSTVGGIEGATFTVTK